MSWDELVAAAEAVRGGASMNDDRLAALRVVGVGWATVDAERSFAELAALPGGAAWAAQERDALLGASAWRREPSPSPDDGVALFVLEPDTEGRLAAFLARFGEAVGAVYLAGSGEGDRVVAVNPRWGPYAIVRSRTG